MPRLTKISIINFLQKSSNSWHIFSSLCREDPGYKVELGGGDLCLFYMVPSPVFPTLQCRLYFYGMFKTYLFSNTLPIVISHNNLDFGFS